MWWNKPFRMIQTNLREIDVTLDPAKLVQSVREFPANVVLINVGGIVSFYPTDLEFQHRSEYMKSDMVGNVIKEAQKHDVRVVGRFDFSKCHADVYENHPDWFWVGVDGKPVVYNGLYHTCINGGYYQDYIFRVLEEALGRYELDGVFFNMFGYQVYDYSRNYHGICQCPNCKERFRDMCGAELPVVEDWDDPVYRDYVKFKKITVDEVASAVYATVKKVRPSTGMMHASDHSDIIRLEVNRALDRELPEWGYWAGEQAKWSCSFGKGRPYCSATVNFIDSPYRFVSEPAGSMALRMAQQIAGGSSLDFYVVGTLDQDDTKTYEVSENLFDYYERSAVHYEGLSSKARVAVIDSRLTRDMYERRDGSRYSHHFRGVYRVLSANHVPFDVIADHRLGDDDAADILARYDAIILPNVACLTEKQRAAIDSYVENGGGLVATFETSLYDAGGSGGKEFALRCLGPRTLEFKRDNTRGAYFKVPHEIPGFELTRRAILDEEYLFVEGSGEQITTLDPPQPYGPPEKCYQAPGMSSDRPGLIVSSYGQGQTAYFPWKIDRLYYRHSLEEYANLFLYALDRVGGTKRLLETNAPPHVEISVAGNAAGDLVIHLVNFSGKQDTAYFAPINIQNVELKFQGRMSAKSAELLVSGTNVELESTDTGTRLVIPTLGLFEAVRIVGVAKHL